MGVHEGRGALSKSMKELTRKWMETKGSWDDTTSDQFEKRHVLPIERDGHDISGLRRIIKKLKEGDAVLLFPEGTRTPDGNLQAAEPGAGLVALKSGVPVLPVRVFGSFECLSRHQKRLRLGPMRVVIGKPYLPPVPERSKEKQSYGLIAAEMMRQIAELK